MDLMMFRKEHAKKYWSGIHDSIESWNEREDDWESKKNPRPTFMKTFNVIYKQRFHVNHYQSQHAGKLWTTDEPVIDLEACSLYPTAMIQ